MANNTTIGPFTASDLLGCPHRIHLRHTPTASTTPRTPTSPTSEHRRTTRLSHRAEVLTLLQDVMDLSAITDLTKRQEATEAAVNAEMPLIAGAALGTAANRTADIDLLVRATDGYLPVTIEQHATIDAPSARNPTTVDFTFLVHLPGPASQRPGKFKSSTRKDWDRLLHARAILAQLEWLASEPLVGVIGREQIVVWKTVTDAETRRHNEQYNHARSIAIAAAKGTQTTEPALCSECATCAYQEHCRTELEARQHPSLLAGVGTSLAGKFRDLGAETIPEIAALNPDKHVPKEARAIIQARSHQKNRPVLFNDHTPLQVPEFDVEIDVDLEDNGTLPYLWGMLVTDRETGASDYRSFVTWDDSVDGAVRVLQELLDEIDKVQKDAVRAGRSVGCFHYSSHERTWASKLGGPEANHRTNWWTDLAHVVDPVAFPAPTRGLKDLAALAGYAWNDSSADGELSILWYEQATDPDNESSDAVKEQILTYNEDDCRAGVALRSWLTELAASGTLHGT